MPCEFYSLTGRYLGMRALCVKPSKGDVVQFDFRTYEVTGVVIAEDRLKVTIKY